METVNYEKLQERWDSVLNHEELPKIDDSYRRGVTAALLENEYKALKEQGSQMEMLGEAGTTASSVGNWDPVLISLVRRAMPNLIAHDIAGVQPMTGPTGLIFAMKSNYTGAPAGSGEALFNEANTEHSGVDGSAQSPEGSTHGGPPSSLPDYDEASTELYDGSASPAETEADAVDANFGIGDPFDTADGEALGTSGGDSFGEMGFTIDKTSVTAKTRALKATYTMEMAQDLKAIHGLEAETELANILSSEILAEINREVIRTINVKARLGAVNAAKHGIFNMADSGDVDGRWGVEKYKNLIVQLDREANAIAKATRRGKGNFIIVSSDVASVLAASGLLDYNPSMSTALNVDDTGNTFAGVLNGRIKVYVDPYASLNYVTVGYRGTSPYDAGLFYCPYVPLTMMKTIGEDDFQPRIGFKTRYGMVTNPFNNTVGEVGANRTNNYFRIFRVDNLA